MYYPNGFVDYYDALSLPALESNPAAIANAHRIIILVNNTSKAINEADFNERQQSHDAAQDAYQVLRNDQSRQAYEQTYLDHHNLCRPNAAGMFPLVVPSTSAKSVPPSHIYLSPHGFMVHLPGVTSPRVYSYKPFSALTTNEINARKFEYKHADRVTWKDFSPSQILAIDSGLLPYEGKVVPTSDGYLPNPAKVFLPHLGFELEPQMGSGVRFYEKYCSEAYMNGPQCLNEIQKRWIQDIAFDDLARKDWFKHHHERGWRSKSNLSNYEHGAQWDDLPWTHSTDLMEEEFSKLRDTNYAAREAAANKFFRNASSNQNSPPRQNNGVKAISVHMNNAQDSLVRDKKEFQIARDEWSLITSAGALVMQHGDPVLGSRFLALTTKLAILRNSFEQFAKLLKLYKQHLPYISNSNTIFAPHDVLLAKHKMIGFQTFEVEQKQIILAFEYEVQLYQMAQSIQRTSTLSGTDTTQSPRPQHSGATPIVERSASSGSKTESKSTVAVGATEPCQPSLMQKMNSNLDSITVLQDHQSKASHGDFYHKTETLSHQQTHCRKSNNVQFTVAGPSSLAHGLAMWKTKESMEGLQINHLKAWKTSHLVPQKNTCKSASDPPPAPTQQDYPCGNHVGFPVTSKTHNQPLMAETMGKVVLETQNEASATGAQTEEPVGRGFGTGSNKRRRGKDDEIAERYKHTDKKIRLDSSFEATIIEATSTPNFADAAPNGGSPIALANIHKGTEYTVQGVGPLDISTADVPTGGVDHLPSPDYSSHVAAVEHNTRVASPPTSVYGSPHAWESSPEPQISDLSSPPSSPASTSSFNSTTRKRKLGDTSHDETPTRASK
ncbi:hypothetical protein EJ08DRAFT_739022 [Tothia fuscella]|uniref:J domain-containing protein n=1 Tax=Tothia fuscella TaxID=1048955 RepID=A0A9P4TSZ3_9PEZI|nr:hypothetical protein EJ08DRAFT_739022 [Tothia fuscella]